MEPFGEPYNWCDRACEVCPLRRSCAVAVEEDRRRWVQTAQGNDADDPAVAMEEVGYQIERALRMVNELAAEEGLDLDVPEDEAPDRPVSLAARRLERLGTEYVSSAVDVGRQLDPSQPDEEEALLLLRTGSMLVSMKAARLSLFLTAQGTFPKNDELWFHDVVPNLLLLERVDRDVARTVADLAPEGAPQFARAREGLHRMLSPWLEAVGDGPRDQLDRLVEEGRAPSPFARVAPDRD